jgi:LMBR1 domain-containing protein 1
VLSLSLACWNVFLLPLDVSNQAGLTDASKGSIPLDKLTLALYMTSIIFVVLVLPFTSYYYEGEDAGDDDGPESKSATHQIGYAVRWTIPTLLFMGGLIYVLYLPSGLGYADIQTTLLQSPLYETTAFKEDINLFYNLTFFCNRTAVTNNAQILLVKNITLPVNQTFQSFTVTPYQNSATCSDKGVYHNNVKGMLQDRYYQRYSC